MSNDQKKRGIEDVVVGGVTNVAKRANKRIKKEVTYMGFNTVFIIETDKTQDITIYTIYSDGDHFDDFYEYIHLSIEPHVEYTNEYITHSDFSITLKGRWLAEYVDIDEFIEDLKNEIDAESEHLDVDAADILEQQIIKDMTIDARREILEFKSAVVYSGVELGKQNKIISVLCNKRKLYWLQHICSFLGETLESL